MDRHRVQRRHDVHRTADRYLGALLGTRPVLLVCAGVFAIASACLPFAHSYSVLILLLAIAGLSSGTFYPLTLSFALLNIPLRYLALTLGLYATCIEGAVNFAPSLYGFYRDHLSWEWMFWTSALVGAAHGGVRLLRHSGVSAAEAIGTGTELRRIPVRQRRPRAAVRRARPGTAARLVAVERVHGARSRQGVFFLLCAALRRLRRPNPLVDLPFLRKWNTLVLGFGIFAFRFCLLATALVIPQTLAVRGFDAAQFGPAVLWTAIPEMCLAFFAAHLLNKGLDSRLLMASGFAIMGSGVPHERQCDQRVGGRELLPDRAPHGGGSVVRVRRARLLDHSAGVLLRRPRRSIPHPDVLRVLPLRAYVRRADRRRR